MQYTNRQYPLTQEEKRQREAEREARERAQRLSNNRLGVMVFQISWIMVFVALIVVYWQLGFSAGWRPSPDLAPNIIPPIVATLILLASGFFARQGWKTAERTAPIDPDATTDTAPAFRRPWLIAIGLGVAFFGIMMQQYFALPFGDAPEMRFGTIYRLMIGYHALHAVVILLMMAQVYRLGGDHRYHQDNYWALEGSTQLWYFVIVAWLMFFVVLYTPFLS
ncbi:MAG: cytochrome c oxidase subunit 3 [Anaerolineae bacterium]